MGFQKYVQVECDGCGGCDYYGTGSIIEAKRHAAQDGYVFRDHKIFCDDDCAASAVSEDRDRRGLGV